jgi:hypothetical protein
MILFHHGVEIVHLAHDDRSAVPRMIASDGGCIGLTAISGDLLRHLMAAGGHGQEARGRLRISVFKAPEVNNLAGIIQVARQIAHRPWALIDVSSTRQLSHPGRFRR